MSRTLFYIFGYLIFHENFIVFSTMLIFILNHRSFKLFIYFYKITRVSTTMYFCRFQWISVYWNLTAYLLNKTSETIDNDQMNGSSLYFGDPIWIFKIDIQDTIILLSMAQRLLPIEKFCSIRTR